MQFFKSLLVVGAALASIVRAAPIPAPEPEASIEVAPVAVEERASTGQLSIVNKCSSQIFISQGNNAAQPLAAGQTFSTAISGGDQTYKMGYTAGAMWESQIAQVEFTAQGSSYSYDLSLQKGNPFGPKGQSLVPSSVDGSCKAVQCAANQFPCPNAYNTEADNNVTPSPTHNCSAGTSLVYTACQDA